MKKGLLLSRTEETENKYYLGKIPEWIDFAVVDMGKGKYDEHLKTVAANLLIYPDLQHRIYISPTWRKEEIDLTGIMEYLEEWGIRHIYVRIRESEPFNCLKFIKAICSVVSDPIFYLYGAYSYPSASSMMLEFAQASVDSETLNSLIFSPLVVWQHMEDPEISKKHKNKGYSPGLYIGDHENKNLALLFQKAEKLYPEVFLFPAEGIEHYEVIEMATTKKKTKNKSDNKGLVWTCVRTVALRQAPSPASRILGRLQVGDIVEIVERETIDTTIYGKTLKGEWVMISRNGTDCLIYK